MDIKWIRICTDIFDDEKILLIESLPDSDSIIVCWFKLLCLAGKQNNNGVFMLSNRIPYTDEMLATIFRRPLPTVRLALATFEQYGMIELIDGVITIPKWDKHQNADGMDKLREQSRISSAKYRERQKLIAKTGDSSPPTSHDSDMTRDVTRDVTVTSRDAIEEDKNKSKNRDIYKQEDIERKKEIYKERKKKLLEDAETAKRLHKSGFDEAANKFADGAEEGGFIKVDRITFEYEVIAG